MFLIKENRPTFKNKIFLRKGGYITNIDKRNGKITIMANPFYYQSFCTRITLKNVILYRKLTREEQMFNFFIKINQRKKIE